ncbi:MAG: type 4a pilus biogenesis protein PilO [Planctomycetaceae bacterium]|nr:type 4a pilus biogenesis protein PilO [Planctomycetaceae bacterium]
MKSLENRDALLTITGLAALSAVFLLVVFLPGRKNLQQLEHSIHQAEAALLQIPQEQARLQRQAREIDRNLNYISIAEHRLAPPSNVHMALSEITTAAESADLAVTRLEPKASSEQETWGEQTFQVQFRGKYFAIHLFLQQLEGSQRLYRIHSLNLKRSSQKPTAELEGEVMVSICLAHADSDDSVDSDTSSARLPADRSLTQILQLDAAPGAAR